MRVRTFVFVLLSLILAVPALAILPATRPQVLLLEARTPAELRETLAAFADSAAASTDASVRMEAGEAAALLMQSFLRSGEMGPALAWGGRALALRGNPEDAAALADARLLRRTRADVDSAIALLQSDDVSPLFMGRARFGWDARLGWLRFLAGDTLAVRQMSPEARDALVALPDGNAKLGRMLLAAGDLKNAQKPLLSAVLASRLRERATLARLQALWNRMDRQSNIEPLLDRELAAQDSTELRVIGLLGGKRLSFTGVDGAPLGAVATGLSPARRRAAIVLMPPEQSIVDADSLARHLQRAGLVACFLDPRGSRLSASADCPGPQSWAGREDEMQLRVAGDVRAALRALARATPVDTTRYVVAGVGRMAPVAVGAAWQDRRAAVLLLISPWPAPTDRGPMRAALGGLERPVYLQTAPEEFDAVQYTNRLADACNPRLVRVAESPASGVGVQAFRAGPDIGRRFATWLADQWPKPAAPARRATPAPARRR